MNQVTFGHPILGGYATDNWSESPPFLIGLGGLLIAPSRGLLVYSPALILAVVGTVRLVRNDDAPTSGRRSMLMAWLIASAVTVLFYARWHDWRGGWCYGPRFLCETLPALCLLFGIGYRALAQRWQRGLANGLIALSVAVHAAGTFGYGGYVDWHLRHQVPDQGQCLFAFTDTQIEAHVRSVVVEIRKRCR